MTFKKVIQVGAAGGLGSLVLNALTNSGFDVSVLAQPSSKSVYPSGIKVSKVDFSDHKAIVEALRGQDVVIVTGGDLQNIENITMPLIDAAIEAGVKRFIPNGWGFDLYSGPGSWLELLIPKYRIRDYLNRKAEEGKITWTTVACGAFYDWMFYLGLFNLDLERKRAGLYDTGDQKIMLTTRESVADSVVGILNNPEATKNKNLRIHDFFLSNKEVVQLVEDSVGAKLETYSISTDDLVVRAQSMPPTVQAVGMHTLAISWGKTRPFEWELADESELVGLKKKDPKQETEKTLRANKLLV